MALQGTYTALITPFNSNDEVDWPALKNIIERQIDSQIEGVVPCGTTGESPSLKHKEHHMVVARSIEWAKQKKSDCTVIAGTGSNCTREAVELTVQAAKDGADYALVVNPYYNKPTQQGLLEHFTRIADSSSIPVILYNIPGRTSVSLSIETIVKLAVHPNIVAVKEATGDIGFMSKIIAATADMDFVLLSGDDNLLLPILAIGGKGIISVASNLYPFQTSEITRRFFNQGIDSAREQFYKMLPLFNAMFLETNPIPVKYGASALKLCENVLRLPMTVLSAEKQAQLDALLRMADMP